LYGSYLLTLVYPELNSMDTFTYSKVQNALETDASETIRPMTHYVEEPQLVKDLFDDIAYSKCKYFLNYLIILL
jgi:aminopeptidase N